VPPLKDRVGAAPAAANDSLANVAWMIQGLSAIAQEVLEDPQLTRAQRRAEYLKVCDRVAKLRDTGRLHAAEQTIRNAGAELGRSKRGPVAVEAAPGVPALFGRPPRGGSP
jgi:hypothetical protein